MSDPERPVAWYRFDGPGRPPLFSWGDWPDPEPDDAVWYPLYSTPEGRPVPRASLALKAWDFLCSLDICESGLSLNEGIRRAYARVPQFQASIEPSSAGNQT